MCSFDREKKIACDQLAPLWTVPSNRFGIGMWHVGFDLRTFRVRDFSFEKEKVKNKNEKMVSKTNDISRVRHPHK